MNPTTENGSPDWVRSRVVFDISPPPRRRQSIGGRGLHSADKGGASYSPPGHPPGGTTWSPSTSRPSLPPHPAYPRKEKTVPSSLYRLASGPCHYTHNTINSRFPTVFRFIFIFLTPPPEFFFLNHKFHYRAMTRKKSNKSFDLFFIWIKINRFRYRWCTAVRDPILVRRITVSLACSFTGRFSKSSREANYSAQLSIGSVLVMIRSQTFTVRSYSAIVRHV